MGVEATDPSSDRGQVPAAIPDGGGGLTVVERQAVLDYIAENRKCSIREAAAHAGVRRADVKALRRSDPEFEEDYRTARGYGAEQIFGQLVKLAIEGVEKPIVSMGQVVTTERVYSERLLQSMYETLTPEGRVRLGNKIGVEINTGGGDVKVQKGVTLREALEWARDHGVPLPELEPPAGEVVDVTDEPVDG